MDVMVYEEFGFQLSRIFYDNNNIRSFEARNPYLISLEKLKEICASNKS